MMIIWLWLHSFGVLFLLTVVYDAKTFYSKRTSLIPTCKQEPRAPAQTATLARSRGLAARRRAPALPRRAPSPTPPRRDPHSQRARGPRTTRRTSGSRSAAGKYAGSGAPPPFRGKPTRSGLRLVLFVLNRLFF